MDIPPPNPEKMLEQWMEWEKGEIPPGELMKQLKIGGMRVLLEDLAEKARAANAAETVGDLLD